MMENSIAHGIGVRNRYALFYDEDLDPLEILRQQEEEKQKRKTDKTQIKDKSKVLKSAKQTTTGSPKKPLENAPPKQVKAPETNELSAKQRGKQQNDRFTRNSGSNQESKDMEDRKNIRNRDDQFFSAEPRERDTEFRRGRGGFRGRGGRDRGRGYFANSEGRNRRMFDRHSGSDKTGVRSVDKRDGAGPNNWGDIRSDINQRREEANWDEEEFDAAGDRPRESVNWADEDQNESLKLGKGDDLTGKNVEANAEKLESKENEPVTEEQVEDSVKEMTLDEWKREQEAKRVVPKYNLRKPGEGEDDKQWKKSYVLKKKAKEDDDDQDEDDDVEDEEFARKAQHRQLLDIQINFSDSRRGNRGRGRGGRGGPRTGGRDPGSRDAPRDDRVRENRGGRGGGREASKTKSGQQSAPRVDDWNDFPSLVNA